MSDEKVSGIQGTQGKAQTAATATRTAGKRRLMKFAMYFAGFVCISILWRAMDFGETTEAKKTSAPTASQQRLPTQPQQMTEATWKKSAGDALPVGVWSEEMKILPGCTVHFDAGNGTIYNVEYKLYGNGWKQHSPGSAINGDTVRFILHKEGVAQVPVRITC